ncbi:swi2 snf2 brahma-like, partial [Cystoisospora suis]
QAFLERRLISLSRFQESLRQAIIDEGQRSSVSPGGSLLLRPDPPRSLHERALQCICACPSCCRRSHPSIARAEECVSISSSSSGGGGGSGRGGAGGASGT